MFWVIDCFSDGTKDSLRPHGAPRSQGETMARYSAEASDDEVSGADELGTLVLRVWREPGTEEGLRIRIMAAEGAQEPVTVSVASEPDSAVESVRTWLAGLASPAS